MKLEELKQELRKKKGFRKAEYEMQWDLWNTSLLVSEIRIKCGLTQAQLAKKAKVKQETISRAENNGCSLNLLNKLAKPCGLKIELKVVKANNLKERK